MSTKFLARTQRIELREVLWFTVAQRVGPRILVGAFEASPSSRLGNAHGMALRRLHIRGPN